MRTLTAIESNEVAGGFGVGPGMFNGLIEGAIMLAGIGMVAAFGLGIASVYAYQYFTAE